MHKLQYYKAKFSNLSAQGSSEWLQARSLSLGGSEMATMLGKNKYQNWETLRKNKVNQYYERTDTTEWGTLFEPIAKIFVRRKYGEIHEFGSIPHTFYPICYSPDGLIIKDNELILLEIKNPIYRGVNTLPEPYILQVQTGMNVINVSHCIFAQFRFRRCTLKTSPSSTYYDRPYHKEYRRKLVPDKLPIAYGYLYWKTEEPLFDLSQLDPMIDKIKNLSNPEIILDQPLKYDKGIALMFKLFDTKYEIIKPDPLFLSKREDYLWSLYRDLVKDRIQF